MSDEIDRAQEREEELRADALAEHARRADGQACLASATHCARCDEAPAKRGAGAPQGMRPRSGMLAPRRAVAGIPSAARSRSPGPAGALRGAIPPARTSRT